MATYEELRQRHVATATALLPEMLARIEWPAERLAEYRRTELRRLVKVAKELSPWHRKRLIDVDPEDVDETTLAELPVMTKDDLMEHWDEIVTDDRLRLDDVEAHLESLTTDAYLFERYHAAATGGSTGRRGVVVYDWDVYATLHWSLFRFEVRARQRDPELAALPLVFGTVASQVASHISSSLAQTFSNPDAVFHRFPVTTPLPEIVAGLNATQPSVLFGYPSALHPLAHEAETGRLQIAPRRIVVAGEVLLPEIRRALENTWDAPVVNMWGNSECGGCPSCGESSGTHVADDLVIVEPVNADGRPVPCGVCSEKIYSTSLINHALPFIRYEITDQVMFLDEPCPCGSAFQRTGDPLGRLDDTFTYDGAVAVHPHLFRSALSRRRQIVEYQVHQTERGATVAIRATEPFELGPLETEIADGLARLGVADPFVSVQAVDGLPRQHSGKLKRFIPLGR
jgi:phenylacetate-CoA ligase